MTTTSQWIVAVSAAALLSLPASAQPGKAGKEARGGTEPGAWEQISLRGPIDVTLPDGSRRTVEPSCTGGPMMDADKTPENPLGLRPGNTDFSFFVRRGNPNRLLFGFDGGGACWDALTCVGIPASGARSVYQVEIDETPEDLARQGGLFDGDKPDNPYASYTQIFVPYCSGDIHWGSKDTTYTLPNGLSWPIRHRGADNFFAVLDWLQTSGRNAYNIDLARARDVTVTGASAGGYGATLAFPYIAELTGNARLNLISDAAIGVQTQAFFKNTIYRSGVEDPDAADAPTWGVLKNMPAFVPGLDESLLAAAEENPNGLTPALFQALSRYRPDARLAALTTNLDEVQIAFYALQKNEQPSLATALEWYQTMAGITEAAAAQPNFRFFIEDGTFHTFIGTDSVTYETGALGVALADWLTGMIKPGNRAWDNLTAGAPALSVVPDA